MLLTLHSERRTSSSRPVAVRPWTTFAFTPAVSAQPLTVELLNVVRGDAPAIEPGWSCVRHDGLSARPPRASALSLGGSPDLRWRASDERAVDQRLASGGGRVVLLLGHGGDTTEAERTAGAIADDAAVRGRIRQRHYRPRAESGLDLLSWFEMLPLDVAPLRQLLARLRDGRGRGRAGRREWELWLVGAPGR